MLGIQFNRFYRYEVLTALQKKTVRGIIAEIDLPEDSSLTSGKLKQEFAQLEGRAYKNASNSDDPTLDRILMEWIVKSDQGEKVKIKIKHDRAGSLDYEVNLE